MARRDDKIQAEKIVLARDHAALTANSTVKVYKVPTGRTFRLDRALAINPTGLASDGTNAFALTVQNSATVAALVFNTDSGDSDAAALAADTFVEGTLSATDANRVFQAGDVVSFVFTEDGTATLPAGTVIIEGRLF